MDYLEGRSLADILDAQGRLDPDRFMDVFIAVLRGLEHAHSHGVVHRDLKPSNIMIVPQEDGSNSVKIVDFGIAKLLPHEGQEGSGLTQTGEVFGSPLYMSPEQCAGNKLDQRSDIYSLGCVMYETLTGRLPLEGANMLETMYKHMSEMPDGLGNATGNSRLNAGLERIIFKAMAKEPARRYPSAAALRQELIEVQKGTRRSLAVRMARSFELAWLKYIPADRRSRTIAGLVLVLILTTGVMLPILYRLLFTVEAGPPPLVWSQLEKVVEPKDITTLDPQTSSLRRSLLTAKFVSNQRGRNTNYSLRLFLEAGRLAKQQHYYAEALRFYMLALSNLEHNQETRSERYIKVLQDGGDCALAVNNFNQALELYRTAESVCKAVEPDSPRYGRIASGIGKCYLAKYMPRQAETWYRKAEYILDDSMGRGNPEYAQACAGLAQALTAQKQYAEALAITKDELEIYERSHKVKPQYLRPYAVGMSRLGDLYMLMSKPSQAVDTYKRALDTWSQLPEERDNQAVCCYKLAQAYEEAGNLPAARKQLAQAIADLGAKSTGTTGGGESKAETLGHPFMPRLLHDYSKVLARQGRWTEYLTTRWKLWGIGKGEVKPRR